MTYSDRISRRSFLKRSTRQGAGLFAATSLLAWPGEADGLDSNMRFGLVTYLWGQDWDVPTLIRNSERTGVQGVELRTQHAHGVEPDLSAVERREVRKRFDDSAVHLVGLGTNFAFHYADPGELQDNIQGAKDYIRLSQDVGGSGVKVKPNALPDNVPVEQTIEQIGTSLNEIGRFGADHGQEIRVEVHGQETSQLPVMNQIMSVADHPNVGVCWNCNEADLEGEGLVHNFNLVEDRLADTIHVREMDTDSYPYPKLFELLSNHGYDGWILLEARGKPEDRISALTQQAALFEELVSS